MAKQKDERDREFHLKYRPKTLDEVVGQNRAVAAINGMIAANSVPHAVLFTGPPGVGKTTLARILARAVGCKDSEIQELNCASLNSPMETVQKIIDTAPYRPLSGSISKAYILDEMQSLSRAGFAQQALLKILEEPPSYLYFFICSTDPSKILAAIKSRCTSIELAPLSDESIKEILNRAAENGVSISEKVINKIVEASNGSGRSALVLLGTAVNLEEEESQLDAITPCDVAAKAFDIVKALIYQQPSWKRMTEIIQKCEGEDPEGLRHFILACTRTEMLKANPKTEAKCFAVIDAFSDNWFDCPKAGLLRDCYRVLKGG